MTGHPLESVSKEAKPMKSLREQILSGAGSRIVRFTKPLASVRRGTCVVCCQNQSEQTFLKCCCTHLCGISFTAITDIEEE